MRISDEEFEQLIQDVIDGKTTRTDIAKKYKMGMRTINKRITNLEKTNLELYRAFITKFPYQEKEKKELTAEAALLEILSGKDFIEICDKYNVSSRTISRRLKSNYEIYEIYQNYKKGTLTPIEVDKIEKMKKPPTIQRNESRKKFLERTIVKYEELQGSGISKAKAARILGKNYTDMHKLEEEYRRIKTEENYIE